MYNLLTPQHLKTIIMCQLLLRSFFVHKINEFIIETDGYFD